MRHWIFTVKVLAFVGLLATSAWADDPPCDDDQDKSKGTVLCDIPGSDSGEAESLPLAAVAIPDGAFVLKKKEDRTCLSGSVRVEMQNTGTGAAMFYDPGVLGMRLLRSNKHWWPVVVDACKKFMSGEYKPKRRILMAGESYSESRKIEWCATDSQELPPPGKARLDLFFPVNKTPKSPSGTTINTCHKRLNAWRNTKGVFVVGVDVMVK